jgi:DNA replication protein DnaC
MESRAELHGYLKELCLPTIREQYPRVAREALAESHSYERFLLELVAGEAETRRANRIDRLRGESRLPTTKTLLNFEMERLPLKVRQQIAVRREGGFLKRRENVLAFGNPGSGKTHVLWGICHELVGQGHRVVYTTCNQLVQELLVAKREPRLVAALKKQSRYEAVLIDDLGYVQQSREEMEVLLALLSERYERGSVLITSNLPFSQWEGIFKDPRTTAASIDRLVHHSVILELNLPSYRMEAAQRRQSDALEEKGRKSAEQEGAETSNVT